MTTITPKEFDCDTMKIVYDYAIFIDRYNLTEKNHNNVPIKLKGHEYQFWSLMNGDQVMYKETHYDEKTKTFDNDVYVHNTNLDKCAELLRYGITVFVIIELGENHGRVLEVISEGNLDKTLTPEQQKTLITMPNCLAKYEKRREELRLLDKDIEYLKTEDPCVYTIKFDVYGPDVYEDVRMYLNNYKRRFDIDTSYPDKSMVKDKLKDLELKKEVMTTPGVETASQV
jgi:hypothetical protein